MDVIECVRSRRTVRTFKSDPIPEAVVTRILRAARWAPSSRNQQPWHLIVIRDRETLRKIGDVATSGRFVAEAPMAVAIAMEKADRPDLDAGRALQQMELVAWSEGLGTCFVGLGVAEQNRKIKELLAVPEEIDLITVMPFGYRPDSFKSSESPRKAMGEIAHEERFGRQYSAG